jgi:hypothetical protein
MFELNRLKLSIIEDVSAHITSRYNYNKDFYMWSFTPILSSYHERFSREFGNLMIDTIGCRAYFAGQNCKYVIQTYISVTPNYTLCELLVFVRKFIETQFDNCGEWCPESYEMFSDDDDDSININDLVNINDNPTESVCSICKEESDKTWVSICKCKHEYHGSCILSWFEQSLTCPLCRLI